MTVLVEEEVLKENRSFQTIDCISVVLHIMPVEWLKECVCLSLTTSLSSLMPYCLILHHSCN